MSQQRRNYKAYDDTGTASYLLLTKGEQAIWAGVYSESWIRTVGSLSNEYRAQIAAIEAHAAVMAARKLAVASRDDAGEMAFMARQMVNRREADQRQDDNVDNCLEWLHHNRFERTEKVFREEAGVGPDEDVEPDEGVPSGNFTGEKLRSAIEASLGMLPHERGQRPLDVGPRLLQVGDGEQVRSVVRFYF